MIPETEQPECCKVEGKGPCCKSECCKDGKCQCCKV